MFNSEQKIKQAANRFLEDLINDVDSNIKPDESKEWADTFLASIRSFREERNFQYSREAERAADRLGRQAAADVYRFFWEFWQNADDAEATEIEFCVDKDSLVITNNGNPFNSREVYSLIFVASTTKAEHPDLMGQFGVGALSLTRFSESPTYHSGNYLFKLERSFTYPAPVDEQKPEFFNGTKVIAPLKSEANPHELYDDLSKRIKSETLLYMKHLKRVVVRNLINGEETEASIIVRSLGAGDVVTVGDQEWLRFTSDVLPPQGMKRDDGTDVIDTVTITLVRQEEKEGTHPVCAYFPTQQHHQYPWRFSAPFDITTGRENLIKSDFNRWLLRETGRTMVQAAISKGVGFPSQPWDLVPLEGNEDELINLVWEGARGEMKLTAWLPTRSGHVHPEEAAFAETPEVRRLINRNDLASIGEKRHWLLGIPSRKARPVLQSLGTLRICCHVLSQILAKGPRNRKPDWYLKTLDQIIKLSKEFGDDKVNARLLNGKCILNRNGQPTSLIASRRSSRVVCNARSEVLSKELGSLFKNSLVMMLHKTYRLPDRKTTDKKDEMRHEVDEWLRSTSSDDTFQYETRFDAVAFIRRFVAGNNPLLSSEENSDRLLNFVRDHLEAYVSDRGANRREQTLLELGKSLLIKSHTVGGNGEDKIVFHPISDVYIPTGFLDKSSWSMAAKGIPGFCWVDWRYRKTLVRVGNQMGVVAFLRALGAATGPRVEPIEANYYHNVHRFTRVTHGDPLRFPNFPHSKVSFGEYSDYGLVGDYQSSDLDKWFRHVNGLSRRERSIRGEALLRVLENQWEFIKNKATAIARGYYANAKYEFGTVPTRWIWDLQQNNWVLTDSGNFMRPPEAYARTEEAKTLLEPHEDKVCKWDANSSEVARVLGFKIEIPVATIIGYLRAARLDGQPLSIQRAAAYYEYLSKYEAATSTAALIFLQEDLIFVPGPMQNWWCPEECLRMEQRAIFGDYCGYLNNYANADALWNRLGVDQNPDSNFLVRFWERVSKKELQQGRDISRVLERTYFYAEKLLSESITTNIEVNVLANGEWRKTPTVFTTEYDELATLMESNGLYRWDFEFANLIPKFQRWTGILNIEREATFKIVSTDYIPASDLEEELHAGVQTFGTEVSRISNDLWPIVANRIRSILRGKVKRMKSLKLEVKISLPKTGKLVCEVNVPAFYQDGNVFISGLTKLSDPSLAAAILSGLQLSGKDRWSLINALTLRLSDPRPTDALPLDLIGEDEQPSELSNIWEQTDDKEKSSPKIKPTKQNNGKKKEKPVPPTHPVDEYDIESDEGGEEPIDSEGGLVGRRKVELKKPKRTSGARGDNVPDRHSRKSTEQRAVDLLRIYVLEPGKVKITDQRLIAGVGADLIGDDNIFRELKARTGSANDKIELTSHEYARADQARAAYELVIVEHVWDDPVITIIQNPLRRLTHYPVGNVAVEGWRDLDPKPRVVKLRKE